MGANGSEEQAVLSEKCLELKNLKSQFDFDDPNIKSNICYGFLQRRQNNLLEPWQKLWFFIISNRPLNDKTYELNENSLDNSILPWWLKFDTLYYFVADSDTDKSETIGNIEIVSSNGVEILDIDDKFILKIDMGEKILEFQSDFRFEREKWYEALRNSRRTVREIKNSISKRPKNVSLYMNIFEKDGYEKMKEFAVRKKDDMIQHFTEM